MRSALHAVLLLPALVLLPTACGVALPERATPEAVTGQIAEGEDRSIEELLVDVAVAKEWASLPDLARVDLEEILREAREANPDERIASVYLLNVFHASDLLARVAFEPYETRDRIRLYHTVFLVAVEQPADPEPEGPTNRWQLRDAASPLEVNWELCPAWRSFTGGLPPLAAETVHLGFEPELPAADLLALVDCVRDQLPDGDRIEGIESGADCWFVTDEERDALRARGVEVYELRTVRGSGGSLFRVEREGERWTAEDVGEWIS